MQDLELSSMAEEIMPLLNTTTPMPTTTTLQAVAVSIFPKDVAEFEIILPCIFGLLVVIALSMIVFYSKADDTMVTFVSHPVHKEEQIMPGSQTQFTHSSVLKGRQLDEGFER